jgi:cobalt-zinc-cadmium resistance protein CzcA
MDEVIIESSAKLFRSAVYGVFIILVVFVPIMTLTGIEGKMFRPMAMTFSFAVLGALILSLTYVPMMSALILPKKVKEEDSFSDKLINFLKRLYRPTLEYALRAPYMVLGLALAVLVAAFMLFRTLGAEFIPTLEEGDLAMQMTIQPGSSLEESIRTSTKAETILLEHFPEVEHVISKIGTAEVPTDPMAVEDADIMIILKEKEDWTTAKTREELVNLMKERLGVIAGASFEFTQPIQLRFNELMTGAKTDIAVKIFGENTDTLKRLGDRAASMITGIPGAGDVRVEQTAGLPQLLVRFDRRKIAEYGINVEDLNTLVRTAYAGETAGVVFENERKFDLVVRLAEHYRNELDLNRLFVHLDDGRVIPLGEVARAVYTEGPMQVSREDTRRRINIGVNVRNRDLASLVSDIETTLSQRLSLPPGYSIRYGGEFENLEKAQRRLSLAVPAALALIFLLLYFTFGKLKYALLIITAVPMAAIGGVIALWIRDMPFSISAGVGFIALFGVAVLNGIVLISHFNQLRYEEGLTDIKEVILVGGCNRLRPVLMTATVAAMGFLPMALSTSNGAEVQKPLATVVIGGLITATLLTLGLLPVLYYLANRHLNRLAGEASGMAALLLLLAATPLTAQQEAPVLPLDSAVQHALDAHPSLRNAALQVQVSEWGIERARRTPPTEFNLQFGQVNTDLLDYNASLVQPLGNLAAKRQARILAGANVVLSEHEQALLRRQVSYQVRHAWYNWVYANQRFRQLEEQLELYASVAEKAQLQQRAGEVSALERTLADNQLARAQRTLAEARVNEQEAYRTLLRHAYLTGEYAAPAETPPPMAAPAAAGIDTALIAPAAQRVAVARQETALASKQMAAAFSVGYFNQSIRPDYAFQGGLIGVSLPLFTRSQRARVEQSRLQEVMAANDLAWERRRLEQQRRRLLQEVVQLQALLDEQNQALLDQARQLRRLAELQLEAGEVDYFRYVQSLDSALSSELDRLELIRRYNIAVINYRYLTD